MNQVSDFIMDEYERLVKFMEQYFPHQDLAGVRIGKARKYITFSLN